ncbi:MAG: hypothetical protein IT579_13650 [Verrucomicrobia subdivision 3 bacterium]|nr:hypothetical protein [Limisphaerales bacterium]
MTMLSETLRSRWFSICLHVGLWVLVLLVVFGSGIGGRALQFREATANSAAVITPVPVPQLERLFAPTNHPKVVVDPATLNLFTTTYFLPPVKPNPPPPPPPPPPTTWKLELAYQGYYRTSDGPIYALVLMGEKLVPIPVGGRVVTNLFVVDATLRTLTLTNTIAQTNVIALNTKQVVEVPIQ